MKSISNCRIAWLIPSAKAGAHWQPIWSAFLEEFENTRFFTTSVWKEFDDSAPYAKSVYTLGKIKSVLVDKSGKGYNHGFLALPLNVIFYLAKFRPQVIICNAFSVWSLIAVLFKHIYRWKVIILYEGSTPSSDFRGSKLRTFIRKFISDNADIFISNSISAKDYLAHFLNVKEEIIIPGPYLLPDKKSMTEKVSESPYGFESYKKPIFLVVGQIIKRKGIFELITACSLLNEQGLKDYSVLIVGDGIEKDNVQIKISENGLEEQVSIVGQVSYDQLGAFYKHSDVLIFPTFEDTWGMVALEAMAFGKPVLCSKHAGSSEMIDDSVNGFLLDPEFPESIASHMHSLILNPNMITEMGKHAQKSIEGYSDFSRKVFFQAVSKVLT